MENLVPPPPRFWMRPWLLTLLSLICCAIGFVLYIMVWRRTGGIQWNRVVFVFGVKALVEWAVLAVIWRVLRTAWARFVLGFVLLELASAGLVCVMRGGDLGYDWLVVAWRFWSDKELLFPIHLPTAIAYALGMSLDLYQRRHLRDQHTASTGLLDDEDWGKP